MKPVTQAIVVASLIFALGCQNEVKVSGKGEPQMTARVMTSYTDQTMEASCGQCQFGMEGSGCDLAVRVNGESYFVDGALIDDHGDAHASDGLCNCVRLAVVTGEIKEDRFLVTAFELEASEATKLPDFTSE
jgi:hypothetical protein